MKELFERLRKTTLDDKLDFLIDTCFFVWIFEHHKEKNFDEFLKKNKCAITTFNAEELSYINHRIADKTRESIRKFLHKTDNLLLLQVPVHHGQREQEHTFVKSVLAELDAQEHDPSDAVILAAGIKTRADILTRDKHDIFNVRLENFLQKHKISVYNKFV
ncbi:MAG: PIN domain-containing protein [Nanoarchaeota archaeon]|nr:PIN domain-containing protein [Nanoarchaeota archaeon]MBU1269476.1 PIN domain-containing protein [Nanoarchaeota archaeon]MBU1603736.1 PIN domain-containing protein [Nanoarchaeota archaeon]MBU2443039.1 PIN domain-containing protein [Nanoarchaeota archaeon]